MLIWHRVEFSAAHSLPGAPDDPETRLHGHNYILWAGVSGEMEAATGLVAGETALPAAASALAARYDGHLLNDLLPGLAPTVETIAEAMLRELTTATSLEAQVGLWEEGGPGAQVGPGGTHSLATGLFPAAHRTHIPTYSAEANLALFGICNNPAGHGHNYQVRVEAAAPSAALAEAVRQTVREFDHRNLSVDIPDFAGQNVTTEGIARLLWHRLAARLPGSPPGRLRVYELPDFFAEYEGQGSAAYMGRRYRFAAAHGPAPTKSSRGLHGHSYQVEVTVAGQIDAETGLLMDLTELDRLAGEVIAPLDRRHLEAEIAAFRTAPATGANVLAYLWAELEARFGPALARVRLWETRSRCYEVER